MTTKTKRVPTAAELQDNYHAALVELHAALYAMACRGRPKYQHRSVCKGIDDQFLNICEQLDAIACDFGRT